MAHNLQVGNPYKEIRVALITVSGRTHGGNKAKMQASQEGNQNRKIKAVKARNMEGEERSLLLVPKMMLKTRETT